MKIANEKQYLIIETKVHFANKEKTLIRSSHLLSEGDKLETRYCIVKGSGNIIQDPACIFMGDSGVGLTPVRQFKKEIDRTYFPFYDDAEEVLKNLILFIQWVRQKTKTMSQRQLNKLGHKRGLLLDVHVTQGWERLSKITLTKKKRSELSPLARESIDERDLVKARFQ